MTTQGQQRKVAWINYVHEVMQKVPDGPAQKRQRTVVHLDLARGWA